MICLISTAILVVLLYLKNKENSRMHEVDILIEKLKKYPIEYKLGGLLLSYIVYKLIFNSYYNRWDNKRNIHCNRGCGNSSCLFITIINVIL